MDIELVLGFLEMREHRTLIGTAFLLRGLVTFDAEPALPQTVLVWSKSILVPRRQVQGRAVGFLFSDACAVLRMTIQVDASEEDSEELIRF